MASENSAQMIAYSVRQRDGAKDVWTRIGAVFPHENGPGFNILLDALPLGRKVVIMPAKTDDNASS